MHANTWANSCANRQSACIERSEMRIPRCDGWLSYPFAILPATIPTRGGNSGVVVGSLGLIGPFFAKQIDERGEHNRDDQVEDERVQGRIPREGPATERQGVGRRKID